MIEISLSFSQISPFSVFLSGSGQMIFFFFPIQKAEIFYTTGSAYYCPVRKVQKELEKTRVIWILFIHYPLKLLVYGLLLSHPPHNSSHLFFSALKAGSTSIPAPLSP